MTEMEYENYCEMLSVMDKPIKMKTVTLNSDIVDGKQRKHVDWNNLNIRRNKLIEDIKNSGTYAKVKEIWTGTTEQDIERVKEALISWGWSDDGFTPTDGDLCY